MAEKKNPGAPRHPSPAEGNNGFGLLRGLEDPLRRAEARWSLLLPATEAALGEARALQAAGRRLGLKSLGVREGARLERILKRLQGEHRRERRRKGRRRRLALWFTGLARFLEARRLARSETTAAASRVLPARREEEKWQETLAGVEKEVLRWVQRAVGNGEGM